jgi:hypothetical protein
MDPRYDGLTREYPDRELRARIEGDKRALLYNRGTLQPFVCDLSAAQALQEFQFPGDVIYVDKLSTGTVKFRFDTSWQRSFPLGANSAVRGFPFKSFFMEWDAQPGATCVIWFGYGIEIVPPNQDITSIGTVSAVTEITNPVGVRSVGQDYASKFSSVSNLAAAGTEQVWSAASNTNGAILHSADILIANNTGQNVPYALQAHTSAPAAFTTGDVVLQITNHSTLGAAIIQGGKLQQPVAIPSGKGSWFRNGGAVADVQAARSVLYTLN